jgi:RNA polymerase sigma-70 factor (ECF subfamily)
MTSQQLNEQMRQQPDDELLARIRNRAEGWQYALSLLLRRHRGDLLGFCHARLGNRQDAEDAVQETIIRAYRGLPGFKGDSSFRTWIHAIAANQCHTLALRRSRHIMADYLHELIQLHEEALKNGSAIAHTDRIEQQVHEILEEIPEPNRDVLMLRFFRDLSLDEIAHTLGISLSATKMRLYRAQEQFAVRYQAGHEPLAIGSS